MKIWYRELGFYNNPFSTKPAAFSDSTFGFEEMINEVNDEIINRKIIGIFGKYGTGKTTFLKGIIKRFGGKRKVIYYNLNKTEKHIDFHKLIIKSGNFFQRLFSIKRKNLILLLDEAQAINNHDLKTAIDNKEQGFFSSIVLVTSTDEIKIRKDIEEIIDSSFQIGDLKKSEAIEFIRERIGDIYFIEDKIILEIFKINKNPRLFLKNCEDVCKHAFDNNKIQVTTEDLTILKK